MRINGEEYSVPEDWAAEPLLSFLRDRLGLTGTKYGCGVGQCGACTVLMNGHATPSCRTTAAKSVSYNIVTIEGLASDDALHPVQQAWIDEDVPQCGYCQSGQILTAIALLDDKSNPTDEEINTAMKGVCRCGTYSAIRRAIHRVAKERGAE